MGSENYREKQRIPRKQQLSVPFASSVVNLPYHNSSRAHPEEIKKPPKRSRNVYVAIARESTSMAKKKSSGGGLMSSAGLMRYYEADESAIRINPKTVVLIGVVAGILAIALGFQYGTWPA